LFIYILM